MIRVDSYPTHEYEGIKLRPGRALPFGATIVQGELTSVYFPAMPSPVNWLCFIGVKKSLT